jgi:hypothetical protein
MIGENNMAGVFPKTPEQPIMAIVLTEEMVDQYDATLETNKHHFASKQWRRAHG